MWRRNLLFVGFCVFGLAAVAGGLLAGRSPVAAQSTEHQLRNQTQFRDVVNAVNSEFHADWAAANVEPAPRAPDLVICRRLSLALTGTIPSLEEIRAIESRPAENRVQWWVAHLLEDQRCNDYLAERLARVFVGTDEGPFLVYRRRRFVSWLSEQLAENTPYDVLARRLIADRGLWTDSPAVNFLTATVNPNEGNRPDPIRLARRVSRAFIGVHLDCVQCHDDNLGGDWLQTELSRTGRVLLRRATIANQAFATKTGPTDTSTLTPKPKRSSNLPFLSAPICSTVHSTARLIENGWPFWITHKENKAFARTAVSRVWALLFGAPVFEHVDNVPQDGPFPPGLQRLADDFAASRLRPEAVDFN